MSSVTNERISRFASGRAIVAPRAAASSMPVSGQPGMPAARAFLKILMLIVSSRVRSLPLTGFIAAEQVRAIAAGSVQPTAGTISRSSIETKSEILISLILALLSLTIHQCNLHANKDYRMDNHINMLKIGVIQLKARSETVHWGDY